MIVMLKTHEIKRILARKNMSQNGLAIKLGITSGYMSQLMNSYRNPSPELRERILRTLKLDDKSFDDIFIIKDSEN